MKESKETCFVICMLYCVGFEIPCFLCMFFMNITLLKQTYKQKGVGNTVVQLLLYSHHAQPGRGIY